MPLSDLVVESIDEVLWDIAVRKACQYRIPAQRIFDVLSLIKEKPVREIGILGVTVEKHVGKHGTSYIIREVDK